MSDETTLLSCPFCGGEAEFQIFDNICNVVCAECHIGTRYELLDSAEQVVATWNTRAERTCYSDNDPVYLYNDKWHVFRCSECHHEVNLCYNPKPNYCPNCGRKVIQ